MKKLLITIIAVISMLQFTGCKTTDPTLTPEQRQEALKKDIVDWLSNPTHQKQVEDGLVLAGTQAMEHCTSGQDRIDFANYLWASGTAFYTLSTGEVITPEKLTSTLDSFKVKETPQIVEYDAAINLAWGTLYNNLSYLKDPSLVKAWLNVFAKAAQRVGGAYQTIYTEPTPPALAPLGVSMSSDDSSFKINAPKK